MTDYWPWSFYRGHDLYTKNLREELAKALVEADVDDKDGGAWMESSPASFKDLVEDVTSNKQDMKAFAFKTKAMVNPLHHCLCILLLSVLS